MFPQSDGLKSYFVNAFRVVNHSKSTKSLFSAAVFLKLKLLHKNKGTLKTSRKSKLVHRLIIHSDIYKSDRYVYFRNPTSFDTRGRKNESLFTF
jgi:hypothetical protein